MLPDVFKALRVEELPDGTFRRSVVERRLDDLPPGELLVDVHYSSLNHKDALSASGNKAVTRQYPHTPGVDAAGVVRESSGSKFQAGDPVVVMGHDLGMNTPGGLAQCIRVPAEWAIPLPEGLTLRDAMAIGTAGFTAAQSLDALIERHGIKPSDGPAVVTGATGGVGCLAVCLLARAGFDVTAVTGKPDEAAWLVQLGARQVLPRADFMAAADRPLLKGRWIAGVDTVGGAPLSALVRSIRYRGAATACGNVAGADLRVSVYPFLLRGVTLYGIDSAACPMDRRLEIWRRLAGPWKLENLESLTVEIGLDEVGRAIDAMLAGRGRGRAVVQLQ
jgi:putative YhdH/YhfP family quinone oxidoreductase